MSISLSKSSLSLSASAFTSSLLFILIFVVGFHQFVQTQNTQYVAPVLATAVSTVFAGIFGHYLGKIIYKTNQWDEIDPSTQIKSSLIGMGTSLLLGGILLIVLGTV